MMSYLILIRYRLQECRCESNMSHKWRLTLNYVNSPFRNIPELSMLSQTHFISIKITGMLDLVFISGTGTTGRTRRGGDPSSPSSGRRRD